VQASVPTASRTSVHTSSNTSVWENEETLAPLVTKEHKRESLKMWKDLMSTTDDHKPLQHRSELAHLKEIKFLKAAMGDFRGMKLKGLAALKSEHDNYRTVQSRYYIPKEFCMPEQFFREVQFDRNVLYWKRCCFMVFYNLCCKDTPFFKEKRRPDRRETKGIEPKAVDAKASIRVGNVGAIEEVKSSYRPARSTQQPQRQESAMQPQRKATVLIPSSNPSGSNEEQIESAEKAEIRRRAPKRNAPIPEDDDETNTDGETNRLFESRLLPDQKAKISQLVKDVRRIKQKNYTPGYYAKDKESDIEAAEKDRKAGLLGPAYLAGVKSPWDAYLGHASVHYDHHQIDVIARQIENIKSSNAVMCQLEYTATKGGPGGQARN
jgi:hypothetical protein